MAEGIINHYYGESIEACSAGTFATFVHPLAIKVLGEIGIDISNQYSKDISVFDGQNFDFVITLCGHANEMCPLYLGGTKKIHIGFDDPVQTAGTIKEVVGEFRRTRDEMKEKLTAFFQEQQIVG